MQKIWTALIVVIAIASIFAASALIGAIVGALASLALAADTTPAMLIGALGGFCASFAFLLNAGPNGGKELGL